MASPTLTGLDPANFAENTVNATPQLIDGDVSVADADEDFTGGRLTVTGLLGQDRVSILTEGLIAFDSGTGEVSYNGVVIGVASGGIGGTFTIVFDGDATSAAVEAVIEHLTYANVSDTPTATRNLKLEVVDGAGNSLEDGPPAFAVDAGDPIAAISGVSPVRAAMGDIDGDGDLDLLVGDGDGWIQYFENTGTTATPAYLERTGAQNPFDGLGANTPTPALGDWDNDGDLDLIIGDQGTIFQFYQNDGTAQAPVYVNYGIGVAPSAFNVSTFGDIDGDGDQDMFIGGESGAFHVFLNNGGSGGPNFSHVGNIPVSMAGFSAPAFIDADGDGDLDIVSGSPSGALLYIENTGSASSPAFALRSGAANPFDGIVAGPNAVPSVADLDGDGDPDLLVGDGNGGLTVVRLAPPRSPTSLITVTAEIDPIVGDGTSQTMTGSADGDLIQGLGGDDLLDAGAGDDILEGGDGADYLRAGSGADTMRGGLGNDTYIVDDAGDISDETGGDGLDLVHSRISWTLGAGIEHLTLAAPGGAIDGTGNALNNQILGNAYDNVLSGLGGGDLLNGGGGEDTLYGGDDNDSLEGGNGDDVLIGGGGDDFITGGAGNDRLDGGSGFFGDFMQGGAGNDTYVIDSSSDGIGELANAGTDTVEASIFYVLGANLENLVLVGGSVGGNGNAGRNTITGNAIGNQVSGGDERDTIHGMDGDDVLSGDAGADVIDGGAGADYLMGGAGADKLTGGSGRDQFVFFSDDMRRSGLGQAPESDQVLDLRFAEGDTIDLHYIDADVTEDGDQMFTLVSKFSKTAGEAALKYVTASDTTMVELDVDGDGKADFRITINGDLRGSTGNPWDGTGDPDGGWYL